MTDEPAALIVDLEGFEGPLDLLLTLARGQKVDLRRLSVLELARQYLEFIEKARALRIELAADYLVMAAWLAYLKSRLLLPPDPDAPGPSAEDLAAHLAWQLQRLEAMRARAADLMARPRLGREVWPRGAVETAGPQTVLRHEARLVDLLRAYARLRTRDEFRPYALDRRDVLSMEQALERMRGMLGTTVTWARLEHWVPEAWRSDPERRRSATAATFAAALELVRSGQADLRQEGVFGPIELRLRPPPAGGPDER